MNIINSENRPLVEGFQEVLFSVSNLKQTAEFYQKVVGYEVIYQGNANPELGKFWELSKEVEIEEVLLANKGDSKGCIRLVKFHNVVQEQIRSSAHSWDTGAIFDINLRSKDLAATFKEFQENGWNGISDPIRYQFGPFDVSEVLMKGPDGIVIAMMERHAPPLEGFPNLKKLSHVFNSSHISRNVEITLDFFTNKLGWKIYMHAESTGRNAVANVLGFPHNINPNIELPVYIVHPSGSNLGSLEFLEVKGLTGTDFSDKGIPPNLGILMYRFPVSDAKAYAEKLVGNGVKLKLPLQTINIAPYGNFLTFAIQSPDGIWIEFIENIK